MTYAPRHPEKAEEARRLRAQGLTHEVIGARLGLGVKAIRDYVGPTDRGGTPWDDLKVETLKKLWAEGLSGTQIAKQLGTVSRCAVIAKVHRLGLTRSAELNAAQHCRAGNSPGARAARRTMPVARRIPVAVEAAQPALAERPRLSTGELPPLPIDLAPSPMSVNPRPFMERGSNDCAWPIEVDGETKACCDPVVGKGWCAEHLKRGTVPTPAKMKDTVAWARTLTRRYA